MDSQLRHALLFGCLLVPFGAHAQMVAVAAPDIVYTFNGGHLSTTDWGSCVSTACAGGAGLTTGVSQSTGNASPSISGASMGLTATFPASGNNVLYHWIPATTASALCDTCKWVTFDYWIYPATSIANYEADAFIFDKTYFPNGGTTTGWNAMFGQQCNTVTVFWQTANAISGWTNSAIACALTTSVWHHVVSHTYYDPADSSGAGGVPVQYWGTLSIDGVVSQWNASMVTTALPGTYISGAGCQFQMDSSGAATVTEYVDNVSCWFGK